jgi:hypothetical protein
MLSQLACHLGSENVNTFHSGSKLRSLRSYTGDVYLLEYNFGPISEWYWITPVTVGNTVVFPEFLTVVYPDIHIGFLDSLIPIHCAMRTALWFDSHLAH